MKIMKINLTKNFTLYEFERSATAKRYGLVNKVPDKYMVNIFNLAKVMLTIRDAYGEAIIISSGYRCPTLNTIVKGAYNSDHIYAAACDFHTISDKLEDNKKLWDVIIKLKDEGKIKCRLIIWEYGNSRGMDWIHISVNHKDKALKDNEVLTIGKR